jgi:NADH-quinone oxidoreductase subunit E
MAVETIPKEEIHAIFNAYAKDRMHALPIMQDMQRQFNYVPHEGLKELAKYLDYPLAKLYSMATFYKALSLKPKGRHIIKVCDGTACHIRGSVNLISSICRILNVEPDETTEDGEFSLELVNCIGACALAPVMIIDETYYGNVKLESLPEIFETIRKEGEK